VTKSVTNALIGILVRQKKLAVDPLAPVAAWRDPKDPRHAITVDNLLRMNSGIEFGQSLYADWRGAFDAAAQMEFDMADEAAFAETAELGAAPGTRWNYTNGNTMLLARIIRDQAGGGDAASVLRFAHRELFDYAFTLEVSGIDIGQDKYEHTLFDAGCDDALSAVVSCSVFLNFNRDGLSKARSILRAAMYSLRGKGR
jgi:hypothetical protein